MNKQQFNVNAFTHRIPVGIYYIAVLSFSFN